MPVWAESPTGIALGLAGWGRGGHLFRLSRWPPTPPGGPAAVHPFMQALSLRALEQLGGGQRRVPFATVVTDLASCFPSWFHPKADLCPRRGAKLVGCR